MLYFLITINIIVSVFTLAAIYILHKNQEEKTEQKITEEEKIELDRREQRFLEGMNNVLNYDLQVAMDTLKGNWSEDE